MPNDRNAPSAVLLALMAFMAGSSCSAPPRPEAANAPPPPEEASAKGKVQAAEADIRALHEALMNYAINNAMTFPDTLEVLVALDANGYRFLNASALPMDPWGNPYVYTAPEPGGFRAVIGTLGADGAPGGAGEDRDFDSTMLADAED